MEFDNDGNFIRGWGGENGPGYLWPSDEHGITVDYKGFVWIVGNADGKRNNPANLPNDSQILKFTKDGKFVMAIGKSGQIGSNATEVLRGPAGLHVYPKTNELFVSDGYGNSRVMVYDADTGKFKRMWGAYGNKPLDEADRPPRSKLVPIPVEPQWLNSHHIWVVVSEILQQFGSPVHDVTVSSDGLVYVCDRGNKRIQVFTTDGKFIAEQFVGLDNSYVDQARGAAFSPDERFLYVAGQAPVIWILNRRTLEVLGSFDMHSTLEFPPGHLIAADHKGNIYAAHNASGNLGAPKFVFKGYSPRTPCPPCQSTRTVPK
jgi:DNA-binding beta-propeller fold protein YncE